jgi:hypothetical protein
MIVEEKEVVVNEVEEEVVETVENQETEKKAEVSTTTETQEESEDQKKGRFQKRIDGLVRRTHDAERERDEAVEYIKRLIGERNKERDERLQLAEVSATSQIGEAEAKIDFYKKQFKEAFEVGDADKATEAQTKLAELAVEKAKAKSWAERAKQEKQSRDNLAKQDGEEESAKINSTISNRQENQPAKVPQLAVDWHKKNPWYGQNQELSAVALVANRKLVQEGYDHETPEFYEELDKRMEPYIPEKIKAKAETRTARPTTVATGTRRAANTTPNTRLSPEQKRLISRLGVSEKDYIEQMQRMEEQNG